MKKLSSKEIQDYYDNKKRAIPQNVKDLQEIITSPDVENLKKNIDLLNKTISGEDPKFIERIKLLSDGILKSEKKLKKVETFKIKIKKMGLVREDGTIPYLVQYLWKVLLKKSDIKIEIMPLDDAYDKNDPFNTNKLIYRQQ